MRCLFCKSDSTNSRSVEHIIPESLGNLSHTLPPGVVCDRCNNYFATKVEKPFLETAAMTLLRFHQEVPNKHGRIPLVEGVLPPGYPALLRRHLNSEFIASIELPPDAIDQILRQKSGVLYLPAGAELPAGMIVSRFLAKVAMEALADRLVKEPAGLDYLVSEAQLDPLRNHARRGEVRDWPFHCRRIYDANAEWIDEAGASIQLVHEFDILVTDAGEWYFVVALFGLEFVINYGGPELDGYKQWLSLNNDQSPLYFGKNDGKGPRQAIT
jgi:hypothetical protein